MQLASYNIILTFFCCCWLYYSARHHPNLTVCLLGGPIHPPYRDLSPLRRMKEQLSHLPNAAVVPFDADALFRWTPMDSWWREEFKYEPSSSPWRAVHLSDAARLAFLWKYGGIYLDMDLLALGPLDRLLGGGGNGGEDGGGAFVGLQHFSPVDGANTAAMGFPSSSSLLEDPHPLLTDWVFSVPAAYREKERASIGPLMLTRIIKERCLKVSCCCGTFQILLLCTYVLKERPSFGLN